MNLRKLYFSLMEKAIAENGKPSSISDTRNGYENHHATPLTWGGSDHADNLVRLTYRQHYIAHLLLSRIMGSRFNMVGATSHLYADIRERVVTALVELANTPEAIQRSRRAAIEHNSRTKTGVPPSEGSNRKRSATLKGKVYTCPHCGKSGGGGLLRWHFDNCRKVRVS